MKFWPTRKKTKTKKKAKGRSNRRWWWLAGAMAVLAVTGVGVLFWADTSGGRSILLKLGAEGLRDDVRGAMETSLVEVLPTFQPGPADSLAGRDAPAYDWVTEDGEIRCRVLEAPADTDYWLLQDDIRKAVAPHGGEVLWGERLQRPRRRGVARGREDELLRLDLSLAGRLTHTLLMYPSGSGAPALRWIEEMIRPLPSEILGDASQPTVAIVVDDWGQLDTPTTRGMLNLDVPLTLSILPGLRYSRRYSLVATDLAVPVDAATGLAADTAEDLRWSQRGIPVGIELMGSDMKNLPGKRREVMLHLPMEPQGYPDKNPGPNAVLVGMSVEEIEAIVDRALTGLPGVTGVNNHMGSAATSDRATMDRLMTVLQGRGLIFVDSKTASDSVAEDAARAAGIPTLANRYFLDQSTTSRDQVRHLLASVVRVAEATGSAVGICHPYPETMDVLRQELPRYRRAGIRFVTVSELLALRGELEGRRRGSATGEDGP